MQLRAYCLALVDQTRRVLALFLQRQLRSEAEAFVLESHGDARVVILCETATVHPERTGDAHGGHELC